MEAPGQLPSLPSPKSGAGSTPTTKLFSIFFSAQIAAGESRHNGAMLHGLPDATVTSLCFV